jgi:hypothetical protein
MRGMKLNPHWLGLLTMALAHATTVDPDTPYAETIKYYYDIVLDGPPENDLYYRENKFGTTTGLPWTISEYAYLAMTAAICAEALQDDKIKEVAKTAADILLEYQEEDGHFRSEHYESPIAPHLADYIYTQNWATLGLYHTWLLFDKDETYRKGFDASLEFLAATQDKTESPIFKGCWRGLYDTKAGDWGGGDCYEGGAGSIYSGWTNAPIAWAFLMDQTDETLFVKK